MTNVCPPSWPMTNVCPPTCSCLLRLPQFHDSKIRFPITRKVVRPSEAKFRTIFKANRPSTAMY